MIIFSVLIGLMAVPASAFDSGSTGALGAFNPVTSVEVELPADGKLNYTTVNIPTGVTVTFKMNAANTPVYMLATGNVTVAGSISISGTSANGIANGRGGPGGFDGGLGAAGGTCGGVGLGPGGGKMGGNTTSFYVGAGGGGAGFAVAASKGADGNWSGVIYGTGGAGGPAYGNPSLQPLIGGSGGGGGCGSNQYSGYYSGAGGGGGGAILIASTGTIDVSGSILANGGNGGIAGNYSGKGGGGSGGSIKLMANIIKGNGTLSATGGSGAPAGGSYDGGNGADGRIRLETNTLQRTAASTPSFTYLDSPVYVFPPNLPVLKITSIGGVTVPSAPTGKYSAPDILLPANIANPVAVAVEGNNIPAGTTVTISAISQLGASTSKTATLAGTTEVSTAAATLTLSAKYVNIISVSATFTVVASNEMPVFAGGDRIAKMRVDSVLGGGSSVTYITESGKEILAQM